MTAGFLLLVSRLSKGIQRKRRINGKINGGDKLLIDLRNDNTGLVGNYDRLKKKSSQDFENMTRLVRPEVDKKYKL